MQPNYSRAPGTFPEAEKERLSFIWSSFQGGRSVREMRGVGPERPPSSKVRVCLHKEDEPIGTRRKVRELNVDAQKKFWES